ncbi:leucine-rich repeat, immunoglobulin-like domain and transmembrane domain-containing protein 3 [Macrobrachium nipponense]|uniref:leucine-rich repeat, immunoglobulin-like domain and transmembrane domain-containing protein 3 n=1 Tax=Macrobrachium nipponense TaxID=159736 RepID=UPI0030C82D77
MAHRKRNAGLFVWVLVLGVQLILSSACPSVCTCKWKNGKQAVECKNKGLASIPTGIDIDTQVLDLSGNNLQTLPKQAFSRAGLTNLQKIHMRDCKIGQIDATAFAQLTNLVELDLSDNLLTEVPGISFSHTPALRELMLRGNRLRKIHSDSFTHTPYLIRLDLSMAGIRTVVPSAFQSLSQLEKLKLQGNQISELPDKVVENLARIHGLEVHDNPWMCDCRALPLWKLLEVKHIPHPISPSCRAPERVSRKTFHMLREEDFSCPPTIQHVGQVIEGVAGENATIICPVEGQPPPKVVWFKEEAPVINGSVVGLGPQRLYVITEGNQNLVSRLIITGAQETDSGTVRCVAENSAGSATANFTLAVTMRTASPAKLDSGHIAGISVGLVVLALIVLVIGFLFLARARSTSSPTPVKDSPTTPSSTGATPSEPNPVQKPPRLTDLKGSSGVYGTTALGNPDVISEAERAVRAVNGHLPNGSVQNMGEGGDYTRMEGDSLYPSGMWPEDSVQENADNNDSSQVIHEHFNPGYMPNDPAFDGYGPVHSTPYRQGYDTQEEFDPQIYGYPADYGLPIPEARPESQMAHNGTDSSILDIRGNRDDMMSRADAYPSRDDGYTPRQEIYGSPQHIKDCRQDIYGVNDRPPVYGYRHEVYGSREDVEGAESPQELTGVSTGPPGERPWVPGSQGPPRGGVAVLPPLPNGIASRIKARDSPDEGYQEGTEV